MSVNQPIAGLDLVLIPEDFLLLSIEALFVLYDAIYTFGLPALCLCAFYMLSGEGGLCNYVYCIASGFGGYTT